MGYKGGLAEEVDEKILQEAFNPFGDTLIQMPLDYVTGTWIFQLNFLFWLSYSCLFYLGKHRGFAFVEFETKDDAEAAIDNMNESEIYGRTIKVNIAKPMQLKQGTGKAGD